MAAADGFEAVIKCHQGMRGIDIIICTAAADTRNNLDNFIYISEKELYFIQFNLFRKIFLNP